MCTLHPVHHHFKVVLLSLTLLSLNFICMTWYLRMRTEMTVLKGSERMSTPRPTKADKPISLYKNRMHSMIWKGDDLQK